MPARRVQSALAALEVEVPPAPITAQPVTTPGDTSLEDQKMLRNFLILTPIRFSEGVGEDTLELLMMCRARLYRLSLVEYRESDFTAYQLDRPAKQWWRSYVDHRQVGQIP